MSVEVELDVFSGLPNPVWTLQDVEANEFLAKISQLPETAPASPSVALGYRGFVVRIQQGSYQEIRISKGILEMIQEGVSSSRFLLDSGRSLERWLLTTDRGLVQDEVRAAIEADLGD